ncbi:hypothetical protein ACIHEI_34805 [Kitasatospora sp. NPDC051984]|uniref:hypothetical protein n=1 Tax=Kitasatospora sp. NPDC051984 TaxID=3364059 RepID=UPI0037C7FDC0
MTATTTPSGPLADALARLPLVARPTPVAPRLEQRVAELDELARQTAETGDTDLATAIHHRAAVLAFDRGHAGAAYGLCDLHTHLFLAGKPLDGMRAVQALTLQATAADLLVREGRAQQALSLLAEVERAIAGNQDAALPGRSLFLAGLTTDRSARDEVREWWAGVRLAHGTRALLADGRWAQARRHTETDRMWQPALGDAQQIAVIAMALDGKHVSALTLIDEAPVSTLWEHVVAEVLKVSCALIADGSATYEQLVAMCDTHDPYNPSGDPLFDTQLTLTVVDLLAAADRPGPARQYYKVATEWALAAQEGYSARSVLDHNLAAGLPEGHWRELTAITERAGLRATAVPPDLDERITAAVLRAGAAITAAVAGDRTSPPPRP